MSPSSQTSTPNPESFTKLRRSIVMGGAIAVLVTGLAVTLVALGPFYSTLARLQETHQLSIVTSRSAAIEEYLFRLKEVARQITSRTRAREKLEELNRGEATLLEFQSYVGPILTDALMGAEHVEGITRCDVNGNAVLEVGIQIPQSFWLGTKGDGGSPRVVGPVNIRTRPSLLIRTPIVNRTGEQVGTDLVLFSAERLLQIVRNETGLGKHAGILFFDRAADESNPGVFGTRDGSPPAAEKIDFASELTKVMDTEPAGFAQRNGMFAAFATVASTRWALVLFLPVDVVYAPSRLQIGWVLAVVALLLAAGTYGVTILLRPLSGRVMLRAEELETELAERRVSEARHRALFEQSPIGIWEEDYSGVKRIIDRLRDEGVTDFRTHFSEHPELVREAAVAIRLLAANEAAFKIYQASNLEEFRDAGVFAGNPQIWDQFYLNEFSSLAEGHERVVVEGSVRTAQQNPIRVRTITQIPEHSRDTWAFVVSTEENITDRHEAELALRESEERYGHIAEAMKIVPVEMDPSSQRFTYVGPQAVAQFGHPLESWSQEGFWLEVVHPDDKQEAVERWQSAIDTRVAQNLQYRIRTASDEYIWVRHSMRVEYDGEGARWWGLLWDDSEGKRAEDDKHYLEAQLRQAQKMEAIGQLTGGVAHDFNNILANILGYTYLAEEHLASRPDGKLSTYLDEVRRAGERARDLVTQMLAFSRGGGGEAKPMVLAPVVMEAVKLLQPTLPSSVQVRTRLDPLGPVVLIDPVQLHQSVMNLCINARDAMQGNGNINIDVNMMDGIKATCASCGESFQGRYGAVSVSDTGPGIPPENRSRMFEPFFTTKEFGKGSGMGLSMLHGIAHEPGGHILVESSPSGGATIRLLLSVSEPVTVSGEAPPVVDQFVPAANTYGHILVVDDEQSVARFLSDLLEGRGYEVTYLTSSRAAVTVFDTEPNGFDLLLTDQTMPEMSGIELAQALIKKRPNLPVIVCTGYSESMDELMLSEQGIKGYVTKPIDIPVLLSLVEDLMEDNRPVGNVIDGERRFGHS